MLYVGRLSLAAGTICVFARYLPRTHLNLLCHCGRLQGANSATRLHRGEYCGETALVSEVTQTGESAAATLRPSGLSRQRLMLPALPLVGSHLHLPAPYSRKK